ncbi:MAG: serine O-acetyltransferase EpsC [Syntrophales bacterium]|jgi:serine O-acetyltransferase|nr:serine O-acetyltransferase EpsC [Syntrophales bacterium]
MDDSKMDACKTDVASELEYRAEIPAVVERLVVSCGGSNGCFEHVTSEPLPSREAVIDLIERTRRILYPGYFSRSRVDRINLTYYFGEEVTALFEVLSRQIALAIRHDCIRYQQPCTFCDERGQQIAVSLIRYLPQLREMLAEDIRAAFEGDPAAQSHDEVIFSYPGLFAITVYRTAHFLQEQKVPLLPRIMTEYAHGLSGIDIHPGAEIGRSFFIDHGTGVVIGATSVIGDRVRIYQGVTLGALSLRKEECERLRTEKRHPTIEDDVTIYSNATILGGRTVIGARSVIGGNVWITDSVPPDTEVFLKKPELVFRGTSG